MRCCTPIVALYGITWMREKVKAARIAARLARNGGEIVQLRVSSLPSRARTCACLPMSADPTSRTHPARFVADPYSLITTADAQLVRSQHGCDTSAVHS